jgi:hypothetical protein
MDFPQDLPKSVELRHSGFGIASFVLALTVFLMIVLVGGIFIYYELFRGGFPETDAVFGSLGIILMLVILYLILGLALGIAGLLQRNRKRFFAVIGAIVNCVFTFPLVALVILIVLDI